MVWFNQPQSPDARRSSFRERRSLPGMEVEIAPPSLTRNMAYLQAIESAQGASEQPAEPKLTIDIPPSTGRPAQFVTTIPHNPNPTLVDGIVNTGTFTTSPYLTAKENREDWINTLQASGSHGFNDYLHWYTQHPGHYPLREGEDCGCEGQDLARDLAIFKHDIVEAMQEMATLARHGNSPAPDVADAIDAIAEKTRQTPPRLSDISDAAETVERLAQRDMEAYQLHMAGRLRNIEEQRTRESRIISVVIAFSFGVVLGSSFVRGFVENT